MKHILKYYELYWNHRVERDTKEYYDWMICNKNGRLDLDGICPYYGEDDDGNLKFPHEGASKSWWKKYNTRKGAIWDPLLGQP